MTEPETDAGRPARRRTRARVDAAGPGEPEREAPNPNTTVVPPSALAGAPADPPPDRVVPDEDPWPAESPTPEDAASSADSPASDSVTAADRSTLGKAPLISVFAGLGLVATALSNNLARAEVPGGTVLFWVGALLIITPIAIRLLGTAASRRERILLVAILGFALYVVKVLHDPLQFTFFDELLHVRTADDILRTGRLLELNTLLPASSVYPGLEILTTVWSSVTGASIFDAGTVVVGAARLLVVLGLFLLYERITDSPRAAGVGVLVYAANPQFLFFNAQFSYESLGIALLILVLGLAITFGSQSRRMLLAAVVMGFALAVTHHLTAYVLIGILAGWAGIGMLQRRPLREIRTPAVLTLSTSLFVVAWVVVSAPWTITYLGPRFADALELIRVILGQAESRELFSPTAAFTAPRWEQVAAYGSVLVALGILPLGLWQVWRRLRHRPLAVTLALVGASYPATLLLRLSQRGSEESTRTPEFVFLGVGLLAGLVVIGDWRPELVRFGPRLEHTIAAVRPRTLQRVAVAGCLVLFAGGVVLGAPAWARHPGPYVPGADPRSIEPVGKLAATWALEHLGPHHRYAADRINRILMGSYGRQEAVTLYNDGLSTWRLFTEPVVEARAREILSAGRLEYLVVDTRLAGVRPLTRTVFESGERISLAPEAQLTDQGLTKWADEPGVSTVFDGGPIRIYDVRALSGVVP
ncbi:MAG TPA: hypothetical protein VES19_11915 [Candidatus Limnocylindrales bacterium]|nr:hypothetical protein [Candidatus Limnocylindrales bacterium]